MYDTSDLNDRKYHIDCVKAIAKKILDNADKMDGLVITFQTITGANETSTFTDYVGGVNLAIGLATTQLTRFQKYIWDKALQIDVNKSDDFSDLDVE